MKKIISLITVISIVVSVFMCMPAVYAFNIDNDNAPQLIDQNSAYVIFGTTNQTSGLSVSGSTTSVTYSGVTGAQLPANQTLTINLDSGKTASKYVVAVKFYDPGVNEEDFTIAGHKIRKTGMQAKWITDSFVLESSASSFTVSGSANLVLSKIEFVKYTGSAAAGGINITKKTVSASSSTGEYNYILYNYGSSFSKKYAPLIRPYVSSQGWNYQGTKFIFKTYDPSATNPVHSMYEYDIVSGTVTLLDTNVSTSNEELTAVVTYDNQIYYLKSDGSIWKYDWLTYTTEQTQVNHNYSDLSVSNDGQWITGNINGSSREVYTTNTETGKGKSASIYAPRNYWPSGCYVSHLMVNPEYPHLMFFAQDTLDKNISIHTVMWLQNFNSDSAYNMFVQVPDANAPEMTGEKSGHIVWGANGENIYWVKYIEDNLAGPTGIMRSDKYGMTREYINGDYNYWHCFPSMDDNFVVSDYQEANSYNGIAIINTNTYQSHNVAYFANGDGSHPNQPHPHISGNNYSVSWQFQYEEESWTTSYEATSIGWATLSNITKGKAPTNRFTAGNGVELITCSEAVNATTDETVGGVAYKKAENGKGLYFDISSDVCMSTNADVTLEISYLDKGTNPLIITYTNGVDEIGDLVAREDAAYNITKSNTNTLKTATVTLENVNLNNAGKFRSDFYISCSDGTYISGINATSANPGSEYYTNGRIFTTASGIGEDQNSGIRVLSGGLGSAYNSKLWSVDDTEGWQSHGITQQTVDSAKAAGYKWVTLSTDGAWAYKNVTDKAGITKTVYYAPKNYRQTGGSYNKISGAFYLGVTEDSPINENDNNVTFAITYLDKTNIKVAYSAIGTDTGRDTFTITGTDTGEWKTHYQTVTNAKLSTTNTDTGLAGGKEDIKIESNGDEMFIASVNISKAQPAPDYDLYVQNMYYESKNNVVKAGQKITASANNNVTDGGIVASGLDNSTYDNTLISVNDTAAWQAAGYTQENINAAIEANCDYVGSGVDGCWKYQDFTDKNGVTKTTFYAPNNWRNRTSGTVNSNVYFHVTNDVITKEDNDVVLAIEYLDVGGIMKIDYVANAGHNSVYVPVTHTNEWKTAYISLDDAAFSSTNQNTAFGSGVQDIKVVANQTPIASVSVMKKYDGTPGTEYEVLDGMVYNSTINKGDIATPNAVVTNTTGAPITTNLYTVVYDQDKNIKSIKKGKAVTVAAGATEGLSTPEVTLFEGETIESFVWDVTLTPVEKSVDPLNIVITPAPGSVKLSWNNNLFPGHFINIYSRGKLVGRTNGTYCILDNLNQGNNTLVADVLDNYGRVVFRSKPIIVNVK